ncbi:hypothetical protein B2J93_2760 [Marssonina coronariae]|uniref:Uncharacterized protein n=1 Tax=Diplocarpon coronariae TaxID=2795749 RepID=A0A218Z149_9HELO|nr:hypothetical protein B2J93_2760 [Marssonina coronariae]
MGLQPVDEFLSIAPCCSVSTASLPRRLKAKAPNPARRTSLDADSRDISTSARRSAMLAELGDPIPANTVGVTNVLIMGGKSTERSLVVGIQFSVMTEEPRSAVLKST